MRSRAPHGFFVASFGERSVNCTLCGWHMVLPAETVIQLETQIRVNAGEEIAMCGQYGRLLVAGVGSVVVLGWGSAFAQTAAAPTAAAPTNAAVKAKTVKETIWVEDDLPAGATAQQDGDDNWSWVSENPAPKSGKKAHQSNTAEGEHQHFFTGATEPFAVVVGDTLFAYVYLDAATPPTEIMLQFHEGESWDHRAYWGANSIEFGADGTESRLSMGALPAAGKWVRMEVPAAKVGLEGKAVDGLAFTLFGGKATWDCSGKAATP